MHTAAKMADYYQARAQEYEAIYRKPERQGDLSTLKSWLERYAGGRSILEIACGTGYWTAVAASTAKRILATDINTAPLEVARAKDLGPHVTFRQADAYSLTVEGLEYDTGMAHFWWSHVDKKHMQRFLKHLASRLTPGACLLMIDNRYVEGSSTPISRTDNVGNTYQLRALANGERHEVLKNFPSSEELKYDLKFVANSVNILELKYFWAVQAKLR
jgi:2-polyprenyl-3-methyl-5-hydroxy-6-metoxy-1,4-benzoquinol methylase